MPKNFPEINARSSLSADGFLIYFVHVFKKKEKNNPNMNTTLKI